jgi:hypothetical protein
MFMIMIYECPSHTMGTGSLINWEYVSSRSIIGFSSLNTVGKKISWTREVLHLFDGHGWTKIT